MEQLITIDNTAINIGNTANKKIGSPSINNRECSNKYYLGSKGAINNRQ
jgi:hypothetical protein